MPNRNSTTPKPTKGVFRALKLGLGLFSLVLAGGAISLTQKTTSVAAEDVSWNPNPAEKEVERKELAVTAVSSTLTKTTQSLSVTFRSKKIEAWANGARYKNVYVLPTDPEWTFEKAMEEYAAAAAEAEAAGTEVVLPRYDASVYNISFNKTAVGEKDVIVIPSTITRNKGFTFDVSTIPADCCFDRESGLPSYEGIRKIIIPATVTTIEPGAFYDVPEGVEICCEAPEFYEDEEGNPVETYPGDWTDITPTYDYELTEDQLRQLDLATPSAETFGDGADFFLGIQTEEYDFPLQLEYCFETQNASGDWVVENTTRWQEIEIQATNTPYDAVGTRMGKSTITFYISIDVPANSRVYADSLQFHNIYRATPAEGGGMVPDIVEGEEWNGEYCATPSIAYEAVPHFDDFFEMSPLSFSTLGDYLQVEVEFKRQPGETGYGVYPTLEPTLFAQNRAALDSGLLVVRYQFAALDQASYLFTLKDGTVLERSVSTPVKYILLTANVNKTGFLVNVGDIPGLKLNEIASMQFSNFTIKCDLYNTSTHAIVTKSSLSLRFASLTLLDDFANTRHNEVGMIILIAYLVYVAAFAAIAISYYFYAKRRFRNDEFRRVKPKRYLLNTIKNFIGFATIFSAILFIYCRWGLLRTTVVTFNPLDAFVAAFTVIGAIFLGFTIKNMVVSFKNARKRKEALRLKLDQDVVDDGTK